MKIAASDLALQSQYSASRSLQQSANLQIWNASPATGGAGAGGVSVSLSDAARSALEKDAGNTVSAIDSAVASANADPMLDLVKRMVELMTGQKIRVLSLQDLQASVQHSASVDVQAAKQAQSGAGGSGLSFQFHQTLTESEQASFSAEGVVRTADGQEISFKLDLSMSRSWSEQTDVSLQSGSPRRQDPLVLNFDGNAAQLSDRRFSFDLLGDGKNRQIASLGANSAYLVLDRNGDGKIDSGKELFGPATGSGFAELARLDHDHNGWIDENDPAFSQLGLWNPGSGSDQPTSLASHKVGAIALANAATPFSLQDKGHGELGAVRSSGVYLGEDGKAGSVQQVDLNV